jgi:acetylglutamate kinase
VKVLIKLGGTLLDSPESRNRLAAEISAFAAGGAQTVVVHGGGKQMTRFLAERGVESKFVNGLRVSTADVMDAVLKVVAGSVNHELIAALVQAGSRAVGLSGLDASLAVAEPVNPELGAVGKPVRSNPALLHLLVSSGYLPVVACIAGGEHGEIYNVNADQMAVSCASGFAANRLLFLTDVDGVRLGDGAIAERLTPPEIDTLIETGVATGGMQAKLEAAKWAVQSGVGEVIIASGHASGVIARVGAGDHTGTRIAPAGGGQ